MMNHIWDKLPLCFSPPLRGLIHSIWRNALTIQGLRMHQRRVMLTARTPPHPRETVATEYLWRKVQQQFLHQFVFYFLCSLSQVLVYMNTQHTDSFINVTQSNTNRNTHAFVCTTIQVWSMKTMNYGQQNRFINKIDFYFS